MNRTTILIIDDDAAVRMAVLAALDKKRFRVLQAATVTHGLDFLDRETPAVVICDLHLDGEDGQEGLTDIRNRTDAAGVPLIIITGQVEHGVTGDLVLVKPFGVRELFQAIESVTSGPKRKRSQDKKAKPARSVKPPADLAPFAPESNVPPEQLRKLLVRLQQIREEDRNRVARAIHDELTQSLTVIAIELSLLQTNLAGASARVDPGEVLPAVGKVNDLVKTLIRSAQDITTHLRPRVLDEFGFIAALEWLLTRFRLKTRIECNLDAPVGTDAQFERGERVAQLYRLFEEMLSWCASYLRPALMNIHVSRRGAALEVEVRTEDGKAPEPHSRELKNLELLAMRERAHALQGSFDFEFISPESAVLSARAPLKTTRSGGTC